MTDFFFFFSMSFFSADAIEVPQVLLHFETLSSRVIPDPTLRNLSVSCMGLLKFSLFEAVEKSVRYSIRAILNS